MCDKEYELERQVYYLQSVKQMLEHQVDELMSTRGFELSLEAFVNLKPLPNDVDSSLPNLRKFRAVTEEGVKTLEISIMTHGWCQRGTSEIRLFSTIGEPDSVVTPPETKSTDHLYIEEGNHRQHALRNILAYFSGAQKLPKHLKPYKNKFVQEKKSIYLPEKVLCIEYYTVDNDYETVLEKEHARKSSVVNFTIYKSFTMMARDYDEWLKTNPEKLSFNNFAYNANYELSDQNRTLYGFLFIRQDKEIMQMWKDDDERNRITSNNFLKVSYPGTTKEEKDRWRKEHLRQMLLLPCTKQIKSRATASKLIKLLSEGKIKDYTDDIKSVNDTQHSCNHVSLKGTNIAGDLKVALQRQFPDKNFGEIVVKFA